MVSQLFLSMFANPVGDLPAFTLRCCILFNMRQVSRHKQRFFHISDQASRNANLEETPVVLYHLIGQVFRISYKIR